MIKYLLLLHHSMCITFCCLLVCRIVGQHSWFLQSIVEVVLVQGVLVSRSLTLPNQCLSAYIGIWCPWWISSKEAPFFPLIQLVWHSRYMDPSHPWPTAALWSLNYGTISPSFVSYLTFGCYGVINLLNVFNLESLYIHAVQRSHIGYTTYTTAPSHRMFPGLLTGRTRASLSMGDAMERTRPVRSSCIVLASSYCSEKKTLP